MIKRIDACNYNSEKSTTTKVCEHIPCGCSMSTIWTFDHTEYKYDVCRGKGCMKKFCESLIEHTVKIINLNKKKMIPLTNKQQELHEKTKICYICKKHFKHKCTVDKNYKFKDHCCYTGQCKGATRSIRNVKYT